MTAPIRFYLDFSSPYAYAAHEALEAIAARHGRRVDWRPILVWALLKAQGVAPPFDSEVRRRYLLHDMARSAAFHGLAYRQPVRLPLSTHLAARLFLALREADPEAAKRLGRRLFRAFFAEQQDIGDQALLLTLAAEEGIARQEAIEAMTGEAGRARLARMVDEAVEAGAIGAPFVVLDGEGFFGADRLPQVAWRLGERTGVE